MYFCYFKNTGNLLNPRTIHISEYDYPLPDLRIAQHPLPQRDASKLLVMHNGNISEDVFASVSNYLPEDSLLIFNETRVVHARLIFYKESGARIEVFCLEPAGGTDVQLAFQQTGACTWKCLVGNAKRWKSGLLEAKTMIDGVEVTLHAETHGKQGEDYLVQFGWSPSEIHFARVLEAFGKMPLPPYINRDAEKDDDTRYQTVFAHTDGSVAAPTAGLHFTPEVLQSLERRNVETASVTLHVGAGTFKPVSADTIGHHHMHAEQVIVPVDLISRLLSQLGKPIVLVGTTTVRTIESIYWQGVKWLLAEPPDARLDVQQWDPYSSELNTGITVEESLYCVLQVLLRHGQKELKGSTSLMIAPGYEYKFPSAIITNFHQPKSTLLLLVSAFTGPAWRRAYDYALGHGFRFLSYGDSCLFIKR